MFFAQKRFIDWCGVVKSIKLDVGVVASSGGEDVGNLAYALVLVREGYNVNNMTYPAL